MRCMSTHYVAMVLQVAASRIRAFFTQFEFEHTHQHLYADRIVFFKAGLRWELAVSTDVGYLHLLISA